MSRQMSTAVLSRHVQRALQECPRPWTVKENARFMGHRIEAADGTLVFLGSTTFEVATFIVTAINGFGSGCQR